MTMFKPCLEIEHLSVFRSGEEVFSEDFHSGLNIIRGENSSGKSTIMDFLFYGLGGDFQSNQWRESSLLCDSILLGVKLNGKSVTLARDIDAKASRPMRIYLGDWVEAQSSSNLGWEVFPYKRSSKESFSEVIFRLLGLPEAQYEYQQTKTTMNQILRLIYSDQLSPVDKIFRTQPFDHAITRQVVGDLLCGGYSPKFYEAKIRRTEIDDECKEIEKQKTALIRAHGKDGHPLTKTWLSSEREAVQTKLNGLLEEIESLENQIFHAQFDDRLTLNDQETTYDRVVELQTKIGNLNAELRDLEFEVVDSDEFIASLEIKIEQLIDSDLVIEQFSNLSFQFCPSCLAPVTKEEVVGACNLCKLAYDHDLTKKRSVRLLNDYQRQLLQSKQNQTVRQRNLDGLKREIERNKVIWEEANTHYKVALRTPTTEMRLHLRELNRQAGYTYKEIEQLSLKAEIIEELDQLSKRYDDLKDELAAVKSIIESEQRRTETQLQNARLKIEELALDFLQEDLERQSTFTAAQEFSFEFDGDRMAVNNESFFSASSMVYMRNSFFASFLFAAANNPHFGHPRLLLMDTIEDKGMEMERSQNFQRILAKKSNSAKAEHQIIIATSMIAPDLDIDAYTVGKRYTHSNRTLNFRL